MKSLSILLVFCSLMIAQDIPKNIPRVVDLGVNGLSLVDTMSIRTVLDLQLGIDVCLQKSSEYIFLNHSQTEYLWVGRSPYFSSRCGFTSISIGYASQDSSAIGSVLESEESFTTFKGLRLGMNRDQVIEILGEPQFSDPDGDNNSPIEYYTNEWPELNSFYGAIAYGSFYEFVDNKLVSIQFGFTPVG